ncbi:GPI inositol-deacylase [Spathaspora sp. JA1]|nr:GPI inositol-deacylase [Spathaspora sp. JA1]
MDLQTRDKIRKTNKRHLYISTFIGFLLFLFIGYSYLKPLQGPDINGCKQVWIAPSYARIKGFDETYTKFASKYSLYLYREQHKDRIPDEHGSNNLLDGVPVLFIPGNAGSFRQARAIAGRVSELYFDESDRIHKLNPNVKNLDVFTADFNEDFTAFHGRTILDQAEYLNEAIKFILELYAGNDSPPKSVIIIGHSMGGIVARVMITLPNYIEDSINTILTLSSPHAAAPLTFDGDILRIYSAIDRFWFEGYNIDSKSEYAEIARKRVRNISLISITGGGLDTTLPADYTSLGFLIPPSNGFTAFTTGIPNVWSPIDHLAIVWCSQLRQVISESLLEIVNFNTPGKTYSLEHRMKIFRKYFLTGFEKNLVESDVIEIDMDDVNVDKQKVVGPVTKFEQVNLFELSDQKHFSLLSSIPLRQYQDIKQDSQNNKRPVVLICRTKNNKYSCIDLRDMMITIPRSTNDINSLEDSSFGAEKRPFYGLEIISSILKECDSLLIINNNHAADDFLICELSNKGEYEFPSSGSLSMVFGTSMKIPNPPLAFNIHMPHAWNSILVYKLKITGLTKGERFTSFMRQWKNDPFESKWYINLDKQQDIGLSMHGIAPFVPFKVETEDHAINIQVWNDVHDQQSDLNVTVSIDLISSLKLLVLRYRISIVSMIVSIITLVLLVQFKSYSSTLRFPSFINTLAMIHSRGWWIILSGLVLIQPIVKIELIQVLLNLIDPVVIQDFNEVNLSLHPDFKLNSFYLGLNEGFTLVGIVLYLIANFVIILTYFLIWIIGTSVHFIVTKAASTRTNTEKKEKKEIQKSPNYRRVVSTLVLIGLMSSYFPYQLGYVICCIIQTINVIKDWKQPRLNYQISILLLMLWILPINIPIVVVYIHNLSVNWKTPFSSHHNLLSIIPIVILVQLNSYLKLPKVNNKLINTVLIWYLAYFGFYCVIYGGRHTYWLHHLFNLFSCILLIMFYDHQETPK